MRKILIILAILLIINSASALAACTGESTVDVIEGIAILTASNYDSVENWQVTAGDTRNYPNIFSNEVGCTVTFDLPFPGVYTVSFDNAGGAGTDSIQVTVIDTLDPSVGFGHECYELDMGNCGDIHAYGYIQATESLEAEEMIINSRVHSFNQFSLGDYYAVPYPEVFMNSTFVSLPEVEITHDLDVLGIIKGNAGTVTIEGAQITGDLSVQSSSYLYRLNTIANNGNPITIVGDLDVLGEVLVADLLTTTNLTVLGLAVVANQLTADSAHIESNIVSDGSIRLTGAEDRFVGHLNLRHSCDSLSPRMYEEGTGIFVIELGDDSILCPDWSLCSWDGDCTSNNCTSGYCNP